MGALGLFKNGKVIKDVLFPVTRAGEKSQVDITIKNMTGNHVEIAEVFLNNEDVSVIECPKGLEPLKEARLVLEWSPDANTTDPVKKGTRVGFDTVIG